MTRAAVLVVSAVVVSLVAADIAEVIDQLTVKRVNKNIAFSDERLDQPYYMEPKSSDTPDLAGRSPYAGAGVRPDLTSASSCDLTDGNLTCVSANGTSCSGHGRCVCGWCQCYAGWEGVNCSCQASLCRRMAVGSVPCGGPERGECVCDSCHCQPGWAGLFCDCTLSEDGCGASKDRNTALADTTAPDAAPAAVDAATAAAEVCSGRGDCVCGACVGCKAPFWGRYCHLGPNSTCPGRLGRCLRCRLTSLLRRGGAGWCRACAGSRLVLLVQDELGALPDMVHWCRVPLGRCRVPVMVQRSHTGRTLARVVAADLLCDDVTGAAMTSYVSGLMVTVTLGVTLASRAVM